MAEQRFNKSVRLPSSKQNEVLDRLERSTSATAADNKKRRGTPRLKYRCDNIPIAITHPGGGVVRFIVSARNLSSGGMSFLHGGFLHNSSEIRAALPTLDFQMIQITGKVVMCRHLDIGIHEICVCFHEKIDTALFLDLRDAPTEGDQRAIEAPSLTGEALCVITQEVQSRLLAHQFRATGITPTIAAHLGSAIDWLKRQSFDLIAIDLDDPGSEETVRAIRAARHSGPILALASEGSAEVSRPAEDALEVLRKPYDACQLWLLLTKLLGAGSAAARDPIISELSGEPGTADLITQFLTHVSASVRQLHAALEANEVAKVRSICQALLGTASGYGYPQLTDAARAAFNSLEASGSLESALHEIRRMESIAQRMQIPKGA